MGLMTNDTMSEWVNIFQNKRQISERKLEKQTLPAAELYKIVLLFSPQNH